MLKRVLIDETIEVLLQLARDFARLPRTGPIDKSSGPLSIKAMYPLSHGRVSKVELIRDLLHASAFDDFTNGLGAPKEPRLFGLFDEGI